MRAALEGSAFAVIDVASGRTLAEQRSEWIDTPVWPGSIAKIAILAGALEDGTLTADTRITCTRHVRLADGRDVDCAHPPLDRPLSIVDALALSCNVFTATVARTMTPAALTRAFVRFGLPPSPASWQMPPPMSTPAPARTQAQPGVDDRGAANDRVAIALGLAGNKVPPRTLLALMRRVAVSTDGRDHRPSKPMVAGPAGDSLQLIREGLAASARTGTASGFAAAGVDAMAKTGTALMPNRKPLGLVIAAWPSTAPREALVLALPGGSGAQAAEVAALLVRQRTAPRVAAAVTGANGAAAPAEHGARSAEDAAAAARVGDATRTGDVARDDDVVRIGVPVGVGYRVEALPFEDYIARVVSGESSGATPEPVREALAITARTYALVNRHRHAADGFDLCTLTHCQVTRPATPESRRAADRTRGQILVRPRTAAGARAGSAADADAKANADATPAPVFYSASCGGSLEDASVVLPDVARGSLAWLAARPDPAGVAEPEWHTEIRAADLLRALRGAGLRGDHLRHLAVERTPGGIVSRVALDGLVPSEISGDEFRRLVGRQLGWEKLKSLRFTVTRTAAGYRFAGRGHGHGVGLCVYGASALAARGYTTSQLLNAYFPGLTIVDTAAAAAARSSAANAASGGARAPAPSSVTSAPPARTTTTTAAASRDVVSSARSHPDASRVEATSHTPNPAAARMAGGMVAGMGLPVADAGGPAAVTARSKNGVEAFSLRLPVEDEAAREDVRRLIARAMGELSKAMDVAPAAGLAIVFHPTGESYRRATGRPWWTAAATMFGPPSRGRGAVGITIHLVPLSALRNNGRLIPTLRHELVHALAGPLLRTRPLWVQEGLAVHFAGEEAADRPPAAPPAPADCPDDRAFRQARDRSATDRAYRAASACVTRALATGTPWRDIGSR